MAFFKDSKFLFVYESNKDIVNRIIYHLFTEMYIGN